LPDELGVVAPGDGGALEASSERERFSSHAPDAAPVPSPTPVPPSSQPSRRPSVDPDRLTRDAMAEADGSLHEQFQQVAAGASRPSEGPAEPSPAWDLPAAELYPGGEWSAPHTFSAPRAVEAPPSAFVPETRPDGPAALRGAQPPPHHAPAHSGQVPAFSGAQGFPQMANHPAGYQSAAPTETQRGVAPAPAVSGHAPSGPSFPAQGYASRQAPPRNPWSVQTHLGYQAPEGYPR